MDIYLSMPITGYDLEERKAFAETLKKQISSSENHLYTPFDIEGYKPDQSWEWYLVRDLALIRCCDCVLLAKGWQESKGCLLEKAEAERADIMCFGDVYL